MTDTVRVYEDEGDAWRWSRVAPNGDKTAASGESFDSKDNAIRAAEREAEGTDAVVVVEEK